MRARGVTLIELVIVIVAITAGAALIGTSFTEPARSIIDNENIQLAWQVAQACADHTMGRARSLYSNITVGMANPCPTFNGITPGFTVTDTSGAGACTGIAGAGVCRKVAITASRGGYTASITLMIANY
jgi:type II secretory pathway pseudopilin PulG